MVSILRRIEMFSFSPFMHFITKSLQLVPLTKIAVFVFSIALASRSSRALFPF